jgi:hypothetical protein
VSAWVGEDEGNQTRKTHSLQHDSRIHEPNSRFLLRRIHSSDARVAFCVKIVRIFNSPMTMYIEEG